MPTDVSDFKRIYRTPVGGDFAEVLERNLRREEELKYGENPNQPAAIYIDSNSALGKLVSAKLVKSGKGGWSATNYMDVLRGMDILKFFDKPAAAVMKHLIPSGFAVQYGGNRLQEIYRNAREADARSAFGSVVVLNRPLDKETATELMTTYVEAVAAPEFEEGVMPILDAKKDLRAIHISGLDKIPRFNDEALDGEYDAKGLPFGRTLMQKPYLTSIKGPKDLIVDPLVKRTAEGKAEEVFVERAPTLSELEDMLTAWHINIGVRSNGIVIVKNGVTLAIGSGQQERVGAVEQAIVKGYQKYADRQQIKYDPLFGIMQCITEVSPLKGAVVSSDAFFPKTDNIALLARVGISGIIQPGGSVKDLEVIQAVNRYQMAMAFTLERCFVHI